MPPRPNETRRAQLLDALEEIVLAEGFEHLRVGELANRLRCSRSTLYKLALSKDELIVLVVERYADRAVREAIDRAEAVGDHVDRLTAFLEVIAEWQTRGSLDFWRDAYAFGPTADRFAEKRAWGIQRLRAYLEQGIAEGVWRPANTEFLAHVIWLGATASRDPEVLRRSGLDSGEAVREIGRLLRSGMGFHAGDAEGGGRRRQRHRRERECA
jgi:AcrR family transcriptional regulator